MTTLNDQIRAHLGGGPPPRRNQVPKPVAAAMDANRRALEASDAKAIRATDAALTAAIDSAAATDLMNAAIRGH